jgi:hypothetical protein
MHPFITGLKTWNWRYLFPTYSWALALCSFYLHKVFINFIPLTIYSYFKCESLLLNFPQVLETNLTKILCKRYAIQCFDINIYCEMMMAIKLINISITSHSYHLSVSLLFFIHLFTCAYNVWVISPPCPLPPLSPPHPPRFQAETVLPLSLILLKKRHKHNKKDIVFLLVELRIAIQKDS